MAPVIRSADYSSAAENAAGFFGIYFIEYSNS
jgi:hypothetical protein